MNKKLIVLLGSLFVLALTAFSVLPTGDHSQAVALNPTATSAPPATATTAPTNTPRPWSFPAGTTIAGVDVGGLNQDGASIALSRQFADLHRPLKLKAGAKTATISTDGVLILPSIETIVKQAAETAHDKPTTIPLKVQINRTQLEDRLKRILEDVNQPVASTVVSDAKAITQTFTFVAQPGVKVDFDQAIAQVTKALTDTTTSEITLQTEVVQPQRAKLSDLEQVLEEHAKYWKGIAGFYVYDLQTGESIAYHGDTVFSGASVMKVPIMIFTYSRLGKLDEKQHEWLRLVISESKNIEANNLLAAAVGGSGTEDALDGVNEMTKMLQGLGLEHTYQIIPYESGEYLIQISKLPSGGPKFEGTPPFTDADPYLRTTPREMGKLFVMLAQCRDGGGPLIQKYGDRLNKQLCQEMIDWLQLPHDQERMVAGIPAGVPVAHKGGWTEDFQGDVGIVDSPGGRYVAAIYIYRDLKDGYVSDAEANPSPYLADFSHTIYTFFNPVPLKDAQVGETPTPTQTPKKK